MTNNKNRRMKIKQSQNKNNNKQSDNIIQPVQNDINSQHFDIVPKNQVNNDLVVITQSNPLNRVEKPDQSLETVTKQINMSNSHVDIGKKIHDSDSINEKRAILKSNSSELVTLEKNCKELTTEKENETIENYPSTIKQKIIYGRNEIMNFINNYDVPPNLNRTKHYFESKPNNFKFLITDDNGNDNIHLWQFKVQPKLIHHENGYIPPQKRQAKTEDELLIFKRNIKDILNKMTPENFDACIVKIKDLQINDVENLNIFVDLIFEKSIQEESYSKIYSRILSRFKNMSASNVTVRSVLLIKCQNMFQGGLDSLVKQVSSYWTEKVNAEKDERMKNLLRENLGEQIKKAQDKYFGNMKLISELYLQGIATSKIINFCIKELFKNKFDAISIEAICKILQVAGPRFESNHGTQFNELMSEIEELSNSSELDKRSKFKLKDLIDMRNRNWQLREIQKAKFIEPKKLEELKHEDDNMTMNKNKSHYLRNPLQNFNDKSKFQLSDDGWKTVTKIDKIVVPTTNKINVPSYTKFDMLMKLENEEDVIEKTPVIQVSQTDEEMETELFSNIMKNNASVDDWKKIRNPIEIIEKWLDKMLERKSDCRISLGNYFNNLLKSGVVPVKTFVTGTNLLMESIDDLIDDIPKIWIYLAEFFERFIENENSDVKFLKDIFQSIEDEENGSKFISLIKMKCSDRLGNDVVEIVFRDFLNI